MNLRRGKSMNAFIPIRAQIEAVKLELRALLDAQGNVPAGFNIDDWLQEWLQRQQPALGGRLPTVASRIGNRHRVSSPRAGVHT